MFFLSAMAVPMLLLGVHVLRDAMSGGEPSGDLVVAFVALALPFSTAAAAISALCRTARRMMNAGRNQAVGSSWPSTDLTEASA